MKEGEIRGRQEGLRAMLTRQLTKRFGPLPDWVSERVAHASDEQLEAYLENIITAPSLERVLSTEG